MGIIHKTITILFLFVTGALSAQIISLGAKFQERITFQTTVNLPLIFNKNNPHEFMLGADFTTNNKVVPSGLTPQATYGYYIYDNDHKETLIMLGLSAGYNLNLHKTFENQIRISPFIYAEKLFLNAKIGYEYSVQLQKGYPYISVGIGGFHLLRHFRLP